MAAPVGTVILNEETGVTFTKTGEGAWQASHEDRPRTYEQDPDYAENLDSLEEIAELGSVEDIFGRTFSVVGGSE